MSYDHRVHAGNAGDVWKHFILLEVADRLLIPDGSLVYAETHAGRPEYALRTPGDWEGGIGRLLPLLPSMRTFCYFDILARLNPADLPEAHPPSASDPHPGRSKTHFENSSTNYPGSTSLVLRAAERRGSEVQANVWDIDPEVEEAWIARQDLSKVRFHLGDGFSGIKSQLDRSPPGLLFIDPPYTDSQDTELAEDLLRTAAEKGWVVLWWYMEGAVPQRSDMETLSLIFADAGMDCGRWQGATIALAGSDALLIRHLRRQAAALRIILHGA